MFVLVNDVSAAAFRAGRAPLNTAAFSAVSALPEIAGSAPTRLPEVRFVRLTPERTGKGLPSRASGRVPLEIADAFSAVKAEPSSAGSAPVRSALGMVA